MVVVTLISNSGCSCQTVTQMTARTATSDASRGQSRSHPTGPTSRRTFDADEFGAFGEVDKMRGAIVNLR